MNGTSSENTRRTSQLLVLAAMFAVALLIRLWFLHGRWINPDEGAHLMDGRLVLEGLVPIADYGSRQPFYVYTIALFLKLFGSGFTAGRLYPLAASLGVAGFVYLIAREMFSRRIATLATGLYLFLPFSIVYATQVKTQPLATLLGCAVVYSVLRTLRADGARAWSWAAGAFLALGFYVRESSLVLVAAVGLVLVLELRRTPSVLLRKLARLALGYGCVVGLVFAFYFQYMPFSRIWQGPLNPAAFVAKRLGLAPNITRKRKPAPASHRDIRNRDEASALASIFPVGGMPRLSRRQARPSARSQAWGTTLKNVRAALYLNLLLCLGLLLSPLSLLLSKDHGAEARRHQRKCWLFLYGWLFFLGLGYTFWAVKRGFFPAYLVEFLPALVIATVAVADDAVRNLRGTGIDRRRDLVGIGGLLLLMLGAQFSGIGPHINRPVYFVVAAAVLALAYLRPARADLRRWTAAFVIIAAVTAATIEVAVLLWTPLKAGLYALLLVIVFGTLLRAARVDVRQQPLHVVGFVASSILAATMILWSAYARAEIDRRTDGVWGPEALSLVSAYIEAHTGPDAQVMSGALAWEFESGRQPFAGVTHPLSFLMGWSANMKRKVDATFSDSPPAVIVLDGYTLQTYGRILPQLEQALQTDYVQVMRVGEASRREVRVFMRRSSSTSR